jgi:hypothetical protein
MKTFFILFLCCAFSSLSFSANIRAIQNGNWNTGTTWDVGRAPADNDVVTIPAGTQVDFTGSPYPKNTPSVRPTMFIKIYGTLDFSSVGNDKLYLDVGSVINIYSTGKIQTTASSSEIIAIYTGLIDNTVWIGTPSTLEGPATATATSLFFSNGILPVKLKSFDIKKTSSGNALISWVTASEVNSMYFDIEVAAGNSWNAVARVAAASNTSVDTRYSRVVALLSGDNAFRLKMVDQDGKFVYSPIVRVAGDLGDDVNVVYEPASHQLIVQGAGKEDCTVTLYDFSGRKVSRAANAKVLSTDRLIPGIYLVNVMSGSTRFTRKIMIR